MQGLRVNVGKEGDAIHFIPTWYWRIGVKWLLPTFVSDFLVQQDAQSSIHCHVPIHRSKWVLVGDSIRNAWLLGPEQRDISEQRRASPGRCGMKGLSKQVASPQLWRCYMFYVPQEHLTSAIPGHTGVRCSSAWVKGAGATSQKTLSRKTFLTQPKTPPLLIPRLRCKQWQAYLLQTQ